ncbi:Uncharacterised protein [uncultured archaeon]|nr:Uncharacterised protein [uncultured archaeon]
MSFLDKLFGESKQEEKIEKTSEGKILAKPFNISLSFTPLRLAANKSNSVNVNVKVTNITPDPQLVSVDVLLPKAAFMGFEPSCINKAYEKRIGQVKPGETITVSVPIWGGSQTRPAEYEIGVTVFAHYIGYDKVLSYMKTKTRLRVV